MALNWAGQAREAIKLSPPEYHGSISEAEKLQLRKWTETVNMRDEMLRIL